MPSPAVRLRVFALFIFGLLALASAAVRATAADPAVGQTVTFTVSVASGTAPFNYQWSDNGVALPGATSPSYVINDVQMTAAGVYSVVVSNSAGSVTASTTLNVVAAAVPVITSQPASQTVTAGGSVSFTVAASGSPAPTYQWMLNGTAISGATSPTLTIASVQAANAGTYSVVATNLAGAVTSNAATLTVNPAAIAPVFTTQPTGQTVTAGSSVTFSAVASGSPAPTYQWLLIGTAISGATSASYTISSAQSANAGSYTVVATNSAGTATSNAATLTVNPAASAPVFTTQPTSQTVTTGGSATFRAAASGSPAPTYQWMLNGTAISAATGATLTIANVQAANAGTYSVTATNVAGSATSNPAVLAIGSAPVITTQPVGKTVAAGTSVTLTVAASGSPTLTYQWSLNGTGIGGATSSSLTIANVQVANAGSYSVAVANPFGSVTSAGATLNVQTKPVITTQPASQVLTAGGSVTFTVVASGSPAPTYQWRKNGANIRRATGSSYTIAATTANNTGSYSVTVTNAAGSVTSTAAVLTVRATTPSVVYQVDFNGDGQSDILWQDTVTGACQVWLMSGTTVSSVVQLGTMPAGWVLEGTGDFNHDGRTDVLWQNSTTGECRVWLMSGTTISSVVSLGTVAAGWEIGGTGDFNGDGQSDILWQNNLTGDRSIWLMSGTTVASVVDLGTVSIDWQIMGSGDFNHDGRSDILWQNNATGECRVWLMSGTTVGSVVSLGTVTAGWEICGTGAFGGGTQSDILWQNSVTGACQVWIMSGTTVSSTVSLGTVALDWVMQN